MQNVKEILGIIRENKILSFIVVFSLIVILGSGIFVLNTNKTSGPVTSPVLGAKTEKPTATSTPSLSPTPTVVPTIKPKTVLSIKSPTPTPTSVPNNPPAGGQNSSPTSTPAPAQNTNSSPTSTPTPTEAPTPTPVADQVTVKAGSDTWVATLNPGENAFEVIKRAVGDGLKYDTYECCGAFITGFHGTAAVYPQWWEFFINGASSSVGVSVYNPVNGDVLEFVYHE